MNNLYIELRTLHRGSTSHDIAQHLLTRQFLGKSIIIADSPVAMASAVGKQWQQLYRDVQRERASTLQPARVREMNREIAHMQQLRILADSPVRSAAETDVLVVQPDAAATIVKNCQTLYIACKLGEETLAQLLANMPAHAVVVRY